jgi:5-formyltetrahydrofolate cyclo-ligase
MRISSEYKKIPGLLMIMKRKETIPPPTSNHIYPNTLLLPMREQKSKIREILRHRKDAMAPEDRLKKSQALCNHLMTLLTKDETVMAYTSKEKEVNTVPLITALLKQGNPVIVPIIVKEDVSLRLSYLEDLAALVPSTFGVPEPIGSEIPARGEDVDTIILPMLGFDRTGGRIGYGAGYYDRFLEKYPDLHKIGIAFACQEMDNLPLDTTDVRMDHIVTEDGVIYSRG